MSEVMVPEIAVQVSGSYRVSGVVVVVSEIMVSGKVVLEFMASEAMMLVVMVLRSHVQYGEVPLKPSNTALPTWCNIYRTFHNNMLVFGWYWLVHPEVNSKRVMQLRANMLWMNYWKLSQWLEKCCNQNQSISSPLQCFWLMQSTGQSTKFSAGKVNLPSLKLRILG